MAIELLKIPQASADAGMFNLPPDFDTKKFAAEWVEESQVEFKQQRQNLPGCNATADGWTVWKKNTKDSPIKVKGSGSKTFVLMCRSLEVQKQVNALYGNVSKKQFNREVTGGTVAGEGLQDPGILTEKSLQRVIGKETAVEESVLAENRLSPETATT